MKKALLPTGTVLATVLLLSACGDDSDTNKNPIKTETSTTDTGVVTDKSNTADDQAAMIKKMDELDYVEFELEVDYGNDKEYELSLEKDNGQIEAKLEDELDNRKLMGQEAFDEIYPKLKDLSFSKDMPKDEAIQHALEAFSLPDDYVKFEMDITFHDNTEISIEDRK